MDNGPPMTMLAFLRCRYYCCSGFSLSLRIVVYILLAHDNLTPEKKKKIEKGRTSMYSRKRKYCCRIRQIFSFALLFLLLFLRYIHHEVIFYPHGSATAPL